jgi:hypothetical protein
MSGSRIQGSATARPSASVYPGWNRGSPDCCLTAQTTPLNPLGSGNGRYAAAQGAGHAQRFLAAQGSSLAPCRLGPLSRLRLG